MQYDTNSQHEPLVACVTGATGMIGCRVVSKLLERGHKVRVLTRRPYIGREVQVFKGDLADESGLDRFISGADIVFHCAAELNDESKMWEVNVNGTDRIAKYVRRHKIKYFCYLSSAGVVGRTSQKIVDEYTRCNPKNSYEKSKHEAEIIAGKQISGCNIIILRPTNVVDQEHLGDINLPESNSLISLIKAFVKGGECAHLVHADDVAEAALFFLNRPSSASPRVFFVSIDDDPLNTVANVWSLYRGMKLAQYKNSIAFPHLPIIIPWFLRKLVGRAGNFGDVKYSSSLLISEGFRFSFGVQDIVKKLYSTAR